jgi:hypothetical protein
MTKIMFYGTRDYEKNDALNWGKANKSKPLAKSTVSSLKISSVVTTSTLFALPQFKASFFYRQLKKTYLCNYKFIQNEVRLLK